MTDITIPRDVAEQALEALTVAWQQNPRWQITDSMHALRERLAQQEQDRQSTHSEDCWRWHHECAVAKIERLAQPEQEPLQFKCTVIDDAHPNGVPLEQWGKQPEQEPAHNVHSNGRHSPLLTHMMNKQTTPPQPQRKWVGSADLADSNAYLTPQHKGEHMTDRELMQQALGALYNMVEDGDITDKQQAMATITVLRERLAQPEQEPVAWIYEGGHSNLFGLDRTLHWYKPPSHGTPLYTAPQSRQWVDLTDDDWDEIGDVPDSFDQGVVWAARKLKEKNT